VGHYPTAQEWAMTGPDVEHRAAQSRGEKVWAVVRVASGNFLEMYDFMVFGYYASAIGRAFFPSKDPFASLMLSLMTFGAGFLMRPIGAIVLGAYTDKVGRRKGLLVTLALMSIGILTLSLAPPFRTIGLFAPLIVVFGRLVQGFSAGAELGSVSVYLSEIATKGHKGFYVAWQSASQQVAVMTAAVIGVLLSLYLKPEQVGDWGWRLPLLFGCAIVPMIFLLRRHLKETESFAARTVHPAIGEVLKTLAGHWPKVLTGVGLVTMTTVSFYMITAYTPTFGGLLHLKPMEGLIVTFCVGVSNLIWLPVMGAASDRIGRRPILIGCTVLVLLTAWPAMAWLAATPSFERLMLVELWLSALYGSYNGAMIVFLTEVIPAEVRASGFSLAYSLATALFGGFTAAISTWLIHETRSNAAPGLWLSFAAACGLVATLAAGRREEAGGDEA
jgi:MHS family citrate/tricarballylate:H+ symporter-like MFS transporter